jgi:hypothetical protein
MKTNKFLALLAGFSLIGGTATVATTPSEATVVTESKQDNVRLKVVVKNSVGEPLENAQITLYKTIDDFKAGKEALRAPEATNKNGVAMFTDLSEQQYYVRVQMPADKAANGGLITDVLSSSKMNSVGVIISDFFGK